MKCVRALPCFALILLGGCGLFTPKNVTNPSDISITKAMGDVAEGFNNYRDTLLYETVTENGQLIRRERRDRVGMYACELEIAFNVAASANANAGLVIDGKISDPTGTGSLSGEGSAKNAAAASRGNVVNFKLENPVCSSLRGVMVGRTHRTTTIKEGDKTTQIVEDIQVTPRQIVDLLRAMAGNEAYLSDISDNRFTGARIPTPKTGPITRPPASMPPRVPGPAISAPLM